MPHSKRSQFNLVKWRVDIQSAMRRSPRLSRWICSLIVVLVAVRMLLPYALKAYVNHSLNTAQDYAGKIGGVDLKLWRGGYRIHQVQILKKNGGVQSPLFAAPEVDLSLEWRELIKGAVVGEIIFRQPQINFVNGSTPEQKQTGKDERWDKMLQSLFPFKLNRVEITGGEIHFEDPSTQPPVDIYISKVFATATNLTNTRNRKQKLPSGLSASASTVGGGALNLQIHMDLLKPAPAFEMNCGLTNMDLTALNQFLRAYGKFDVERGNFALYTSVAADAGAYDGYFKVFFKDLDVFAWEKERKKNILAIFWQAIVGGVATVFKNHPKDQLATKIPISGSYTNSSVGVWTATANLLQNAFIHALVPKLDQHITIEEVEIKATDK